jgi:hypothetical protein
MIEIPLGADGQAGDARKLDADDLRILDEKVLEWKDVESEALTRFVGLTPQPAVAEGMAASPVSEAAPPPVAREAGEPDSE